MEILEMVFYRKATDIDEVRHWFDNLPGSVRSERAVVEKEVAVSVSRMAAILGNFMIDADEVSGLGGNKLMEKGGYARLVVKITADGFEPLYVDPQGYTYCRYVGVPVR